MQTLGMRYVKRNLKGIAKHSPYDISFCPISQSLDVLVYTLSMVFMPGLLEFPFPIEITANQGRCFEDPLKW